MGNEVISAHDDRDDGSTNSVFHLKVASIQQQQLESSSIDAQITEFAGIEPTAAGLLYPVFTHFVESVK